MLMRDRAALSSLIRVLNHWSQIAHKSLTVLNFLCVCVCVRMPRLCLYVCVRVILKLKDFRKILRTSEVNIVKPATLTKHEISWVLQL